MAKAKKKVTRWSDGSIDVEELEPAERIAHELVSEFADLAPSVEKIMDAEISDDGRTQALELFRSSLGTIGDPNRDPRVAITAAGGTPPPHKTE
ncbi:hypothetical protein [Ilumatobacter sp.]|jgi:hypothetical protein|uniref:hypothetical protein n=1 Tax=Ilumatobacter sp. TaxID=1967498 RepID=UPI003AF67FD8